MLHFNTIYQIIRPFLDRKKTTTNKQKKKKKKKKKKKTKQKKKKKKKKKKKTVSIFREYVPFKYRSDKKQILQMVYVYTLLYETNTCTFHIPIY